MLWRYAWYTTLVELGQDVPACARPAFYLFEIRLRHQMHDQAEAADDGSRSGRSVVRDRPESTSKLYLPYGLI
jgi:hypothetical protein